jgi:hypothetical protein
MIRYIVVNEEKGIFLGKLNNMSIFSKEDMFGIFKACSFDDPVKANIVMQSLGYTEYSIQKVEAQSEYVTHVELLEGGFKNYVDPMLLNMPMENKTIH